MPLPYGAGPQPARVVITHIILLLTIVGILAGATLWRERDKGAEKTIFRICPYCEQPFGWETPLRR